MTALTKQQEYGRTYYRKNKVTIKAKAKIYRQNNKEKLLERKHQYLDDNNFMEQPGTHMPQYALEEIGLIESGQMTMAAVAEMCSRSYAGVANKKWRMAHPEYVKAAARAYARRRKGYDAVDKHLRLALIVAGLWDNFMNRPKDRSMMTEEQQTQYYAIEKLHKEDKGDLDRLCAIMRNMAR